MPTVECEDKKKGGKSVAKKLVGERSERCYEHYGEMQQNN